MEDVVIKKINDQISQDIRPSLVCRVQLHNRTTKEHTKNLMPFVVLDTNNS